MKSWILFFFMLVGVQGWGQSDTVVFDDPKSMMEYAFSNTDFNSLNGRFYANRTIDKNYNLYNYFLSHPNKSVTGVSFIQLFTYLEWWDKFKSIHRDSVLFPILDHLYTLDGERTLRIPVFLVDVDVENMDSSAWQGILNSSSNQPFEKFSNSSFNTNHVEHFGIYIDSFAYSNVVLYLNDSTVFSNRNRQIVYVELNDGNESKRLNYGEKLDISNWFNDKRLISLTAHYSDSSETTYNQHLEIHPLKLNLPKSAWLNKFYDYGIETFTYDGSQAPSISNPEIKFSIAYACEDRVLRKPYIMVNGWGPHTDRASVNNEFGWPNSLFNLIVQTNQAGLIENLLAGGFDVIHAQFYPPNAYIERNADMLERLINEVNTRKFGNGSYEENIIQGFSAGALAVRLALQQMEHKYLNNQGRHPHTKLYISTDGEHLGANIPIGTQGLVNYMFNYEYDDGDIILDPIAQIFANSPAKANYGLYYILHAPLTKQLLYYFHTKTGNSSNPGQGPHPMRNTYLAKHTFYNHSLNPERLGYPSFQRMISISNGSSVPNYINNESIQDPYPPEMGAIFLSQTNTVRRWRGTFAKPGLHRVFYFEYKPLFRPWKVLYEEVMNNPLVLDNAPGGMIFITQNPLRSALDLFEFEVVGSPEVRKDHLFSFTPTIFTHDVRNTTGNLTNGYLNYDFKDNFLMFDNESSANSNDPNNSSNFFGYPHLGYPTDHYTVTPFDALFTFDKNTEHLIFDEKDINAYAGIPSISKGVYKNFVVDESEFFNIFLQNKRIGYYTKPGDIYRVDYEAQNSILLGEHVTQKTDFLPLVIQANAIVSAQAGQEIHFLPGVHIENGANTHFFIGDITCEKSTSNGTFQPENETSYHSSSYTSNYEKDQPILFPNPSQKTFTLEWGERTIFEVHITDLSGNKVWQGIVKNQEMQQHDLMPGCYIVQIKYENQWKSLRLIVQ